MGSRRVTVNGNFRSHSPTAIRLDLDSQELARQALEEQNVATFSPTSTQSARRGDGDRLVTAELVFLPLLLFFVILITAQGVVLIGVEDSPLQAG
jgi:hypothetical protein